MILYLAIPLLIFANFIVVALSVVCEGFVIILSGIAETKRYQTFIGDINSAPVSSPSVSLLLLSSSWVVCLDYL